MMKPFSYRLITAPRPIGRLLAAELKGRLMALLFVKTTVRDAVREVEELAGLPGRKGKTVLLEKTANQLGEYFSGQRRKFDLPLALSGTVFQREAWDALRRIPYGRTLSYSEQARRMGRPRAQRAVGSANGRNPVAIVVPCHRVISSSGSLGGYGPGLEKKQWLLDLEKEGRG